MNRNTKKGFTIVELIIVIAVIAVLAAVLIPTFSNLINQAQQAKDTALVSDLNKGLKMSGKEFDTMHDALTAVEENVGINVAKINAVATDSEILWDSVNQCFVYLKGGDTEPTYIPDSKTTDVKGDYDYWMISDDKADVKADKYSIYWNGADIAEEITATTGFDAGEKNVAKILYQRADGAAAREVTIRTNGGELEVDALSDEVKHFDIAQQVTVTKAAPNSYYENGTVVGNLEVKQGHVEISAKASVTTVIVASADAKDATVTVASGATVGVVGATTEAGKTYLDSATTVPADKKAETKLDENTLSKFAGGIGTEASPFLIATAEQFVKIGDYNDEMKGGKSYNFKLIADIDLRTVSNFTQFGVSNDYAISGYFKGTLDGNNYKLIANDSLEYIFINSYKSAEFSNIDYYLCNNLVTLCPGQSGNTKTVFDNVDMYTIDSTTSIWMEKNNGLYTSWIALDVFNDDWTSGNDVTIKNADVYVNIVAVEWNAVFFGGCPYFGGSATVKDSIYYGNYYGEQINLVLGNLSHSVDYTLTVSNVENKGVLASTKGSPMIAGGSYGGGEDKLGTYTNVKIGINRYLYDKELNINLDNDYLKVTEAGSKSVDYYVLKISGGTRLTSAVSENSTYSFRVRIEKEQFVNGLYKTVFKDGKMATVSQYKEFVDSSATFDSANSIKVYGEENAEFWLIEHEGTLYYVFDFNDNGLKYFITKPNKVITSSVVDIGSASIYAYDEKGLPIAQKDIKL